MVRRCEVAQGFARMTLLALTVPIAVTKNCSDCPLAEHEL